MKSNEGLELRRVAEITCASPASDARRLLAAARIYEGVGAWQHASDIYARLATACAARGMCDEAELCYRKVDELGCADPARVRRELAELLASAGRFEDAARESRAAVEHYLRDGRYLAALAFARALPQLGLAGDGLGKRLESLISTVYRRQNTRSTLAAA